MYCKEKKTAYVKGYKVEYIMTFIGELVLYFKETVTRK